MESYFDYYGMSDYFLEELKKKEKKEKKENMEKKIEIND